MMTRGLFRRRKNGGVPNLNTSSLPDLIFTVLFFFMIVTHMRDVDLKVRYDVPQGTELRKAVPKSAVAHIYIGRVPGLPTDSFCIQLNNDLATMDDIRIFVDNERAAMSTDDQTRMLVSIKADRDVPYGMIAQVKQLLQQSFALRISYSATRKNENNQ